MTDLHTVPPPRDVHEPQLRDATPEEVDGITRIVAVAVGLNPEDVSRRVGAAALPPVLDAPARRDEPKPAPRRRGVVVRTDGYGGPVAEFVFEAASRWSIAPCGALRVYDGPTEEKAFNQDVWHTVEWLYDAAPATAPGADA